LGLVWFAALGLWAWGRHEAQTTGAGLDLANLWVLFCERTPILLQYLGKTFLPLNLSVFPMQADTEWQWGIIALGFLGFLIWWTPAQDRLRWVGGLAFWLLLLLPAMVVPRGLNDQVFEHRLYVPTLGLWAALGSSNLFRPQFPKVWGTVIACLALLWFLQINVKRKGIFADELAFWKDAVDHSPSSAYAHVMYAIRCNTVEGLPRPGLEEARKYVNKAYAIDSNEKYVNHYMGLLAMEDGKFQEANRFFEREISITGLSDSYFNRARALFELGDKRGSARSLEEFLRLKPGDPMATNNLNLLYQELGNTSP
jgi:tetratricopeptide (TPR) repeat protein